MPAPPADARSFLTECVSVEPCGDDGAILRVRTDAPLPPLRAARFFMLSAQVPGFPAIPRPFSVYRQDGAELEFLIKIMGDDLKLDGITRNQAIRDFKVTDVPFSELLTGLVMKASPNPAVKDPSEEKQKLIWVMGPDPAAPENTILLITTRSASKDPARKYEIPEAFKSK